ncbi:sensor histidine kinase [Ruminococcus sp.]|uniref:sensor histidine kinase n=1 Tax=Ruminococcus sp. TaxID=41978 RepID=UPI0025EF395D|nr:sensor histidine kinase [Ruminococcus sp.]
MFFAANYISGAALYIFAFVTFGKIYESRKCHAVLKIIYVVLAALLHAFVNSFEMPVFNVSYAYFSLLILTILFYKPKYLNFLIYNAIFFVIMAIIEMLSGMLLSCLIGVESPEIKDTIELYIAGNLLSWVFMIAAAKCFILYISENGFSSIRLQEIIMFFILIVGEIIIFQYIYNTIMEGEAGYGIVIILLIFFALDLYLTYLLRTLSKTYKTEKELELVSQQSVLQLKAYNELNEKYNASRRVIHDVKKHIASLEGLINANKAEEAGHYKDLLNAELDKLMPRFECEDPILTVVINNKLDTAESMNVDFRVDAEYTNISFISNLDVTAIFSNLLDNAFEACSELPEDKRRVWLSITRRNYFVFIYLENSFDKVSTTAKNEFRSTKKGHHGIGMSNIRNACAKYNGSFNAHVEDNLFITELLIPIPDDNEKQPETAAKKTAV